MTEPEEEQEPENSGEEEQEPEEEKQEEKTSSSPSRPAQIVEIKTPLDKPEFDWFVDTFMHRMHLTDRKQSAIMLTHMLYDMGLDPYSDLKDIQQAVQEMNTLLSSLPDTPTTARVKDTLGGMYAAKAGRTMLERFPTGMHGDPMMDKMERIMDKYMPMIMGMKMVGDMMRGDVPQGQREKTQADVPEAFKAEINGLKQQVTSLTELITKQRAAEDQKAFAEGIITAVNAKILPQLQNLQSQVNTLASQPPPPTTPPRNEELAEIADKLKEAVDKMGEKAGQKQLTLADIDPLLTIIDKIEEKFKKEPAGEFDWRTATVSSLSELGKEAITAYKDVQTAKTNAAGSQQQEAPTPNTEMQAIIKRQVQGFIMQRIQTGATQMNIQEAARQLSLKPEEVAWAYQELVREGWINVKVPEGQPKGKTNTKTTPETAPGEQETQPFVET